MGDEKLLKRGDCGIDKTSSSAKFVALDPNIFKSI